ncbi:MAG: glycosyltransferase family 4 protein, partial [Elainellaceae cyanobacterium]
MDKNTFSGTLYYMYHALKTEGLDLVDLNPPQSSSLLTKVVNRAVSKVRSSAQEDASKLAKFKRRVQGALDTRPCDVIFAPVASQEVSLVKTNIPIVFSSDATPKLIHNDYYKIYGSEADFISAADTEKQVIAKASRLIYPSRWSADSAVNDYGADPRHVSVVPFGANLDFAPERDHIRNRFASSCCRLLFIGKDWQRKGGNLAFESLLKLLSLGVDAELTMIGCIPPDDALAQVDQSRLTVIPFLNKNIQKERDRLYSIFLNAHFFLFPTRADCSPIVLCEAAAFGLPAMSSHVGGI